MISSQGHSWWLDLVNASLARELESDSLSVLLVRLDVLEEVVELLGVVELALLPGTVCAGKISIGNSSLDTGLVLL